MKDRVPTQPGRVKVTHTDGSTEYVTVERADNPTQEGTPLNKATLFTNSNENRFGCELPSEALDLIAKEWTVTIPQSGWSSSQTNGYYTNRVNVSGMKAVYNPIVSLKVSNATNALDEKAAFSLLDLFETYDGYIIAKAGVKPDKPITVRVKGV